MTRQARRRGLQLPDRAARRTAQEDAAQLRAVRDHEGAAGPARDDLARVARPLRGNAVPGRRYTYHEQKTTPKESWTCRLAPALSGRPRQDAGPQDGREQEPQAGDGAQRAGSIGRHEREGGERNPPLTTRAPRGMNPASRGRGPQGTAQGLRGGVAPPRASRPPSAGGSGVAARSPRGTPRGPTRESRGTKAFLSPRRQGGRTSPSPKHL